MATKIYSTTTVSPEATIPPITSSSRLPFESNVLVRSSGSYFPLCPYPNCPQRTTVHDASSSNTTNLSTAHPLKKSRFMHSSPLSSADASSHRVTLSSLSRASVSCVESFEDDLNVTSNGPLSTPVATIIPPPRAVLSCSGVALSPSSFPLISPLVSTFYANKDGSKMFRSSRSNETLPSVQTNQQFPPLSPFSSTLNSPTALSGAFLLAPADSIIPFLDFPMIRQIREEGINEQRRQQQARSPQQTLAQQQSRVRLAASTVDSPHRPSTILKNGISSELISDEALLQNMLFPPLRPQAVIDILVSRDHRDEEKPRVHAASFSADLLPQPGGDINTLSDTSETSHSTLCSSSATFPSFPLDYQLNWQECNVVLISSVEEVKDAIDRMIPPHAQQQHIWTAGWPKRLRPAVGLSPSNSTSLKEADISRFIEFYACGCERVLPQNPSTHTTKSTRGATGVAAGVAGVAGVAGAAGTQGLVPENGHVESTLTNLHRISTVALLYCPTLNITSSSSTCIVPSGFPDKQSPEPPTYPLLSTTRNTSVMVGQTVRAIYTPYGILHPMCFLRSTTKGTVSNEIFPVLRSRDMLPAKPFSPALFSWDGIAIPGSEGGGVYIRSKLDIGVDVDVAVPTSSGGAPRIVEESEIKSKPAIPKRTRRHQYRLVGMLTYPLCLASDPLSAETRTGPITQLQRQSFHENRMLARYNQPDHSLESTFVEHHETSSVPSFSSHIPLFLSIQTIVDHFYNLSIREKILWRRSIEDSSQHNSFVTPPTPAIGSSIASQMVPDFRLSAS